MLLPAVRALLLLAASRPGPLAVPEPEVLAPLARLTGVLCDPPYRGPLEPVGASFTVVEMRVADLLFGPRPEVVLRTRSGTSWWRGGVDDLLVCTTDTTPPSCAAWPVEPAGLRFSRPNRVRAGKYVHHVAAAEPRG